MSAHNFYPRLFSHLQSEQAYVCEAYYQLNLNKTAYSMLYMTYAFNQSLGRVHCTLICWKGEKKKLNGWLRSVTGLSKKILPWNMKSKAYGSMFTELLDNIWNCNVNQLVFYNSTMTANLHVRIIMEYL